MSNELDKWIFVKIINNKFFWVSFHFETKKIIYEKFKTTLNEF